VSSQRCLRLFREARAKVVTWNRTLGRRDFLKGHASGNQVQPISPARTAICNL
jgi:hypothetical protein